MLAIVGAGLVAYVLLVPRRKPRTTDLVHDAIVQLLSEGQGERRPSRLAATRSALERRFAEAGLPRLRIATFLLISVLSGLLGVALGMVLLGAPIFSVLGGLGGLYLPWALLEWQANRLRRVMDRLVHEFISLLAFSTAGTQSPVDAFLETANTFKAQPLARYVMAARDDIDPRIGLGGQSFAQIIARLDRDVSHPWFHLAYEVLVKAQQNSTPPGVPLTYIRDFVAESYHGQLEAYADLSQVRMQALILYGMPFAVTLMQRLVTPDVVDTYYRTPLGTATAAAIAAICVAGYRRVVQRERRLVDQARRGR